VRYDFDTDGWHFHPKVAKVIFDDVYGKNPLPKNGFLLTKENVHSYLLYLHKQIQNYDFNKNQLN